MALGGRREGAGRKGYGHEIEAKRALELSFSTIIKVLEDEKLSVDTRLKAAIPIATKYFPEKLELNNLNELTGDQKFFLLKDYLETFKTVKVIGDSPATG